MRPPPAKLWIAVSALLGLAGCPKRHGQPQPAGEAGSTDQASGTHGDDVDAALLERLAITVTSALPPGAATSDWLARITEGDASVDDYIEHLLDSPKVAATLSRLLFRKAFTLESTYFMYPYILAESEPDDRGTTVLYLRATPGGDPLPACRVSEAERVRPWWDMNHEILVCPSAHKPEQFGFQAPPAGDGKVPREVACSSYGYGAFLGRSATDLDTLCGCGPNLLRCVRDDAHMVEVNQSLTDEVVDTVHRSLQNELPISQLLTSNETVRDRNAEFSYRRWLIETGADGKLEELPDWPDGGKLAPRPEVSAGQHAGLLTSNKLIYFDAGARQRLRTWYEYLWCKTPAALGASPEDVLSLKINKEGDNNLIDVDSDDWQELARRPLCTSCHARMDFGARFLLGWGDGVGDAFAFDPQRVQSGHGPLYGDDIDDPRASGQLTTQGFAKLAIDQPEYGQCLAETFADHFLGEQARPDDVREIQRSYDGEASLKSMLRVAIRLQARQWAGRRHDGHAGSGPLVTPDAQPNDGRVAVGPAVKGALTVHCGECHDGEMTVSVLPRATVLSMLERTAFMDMPRGDHQLSLGDRRDLSRTLIELLWSTPSDRETAIAYFVDHMRPAEVHNIHAALATVHQSAGSGGAAPVRTIQNGIAPRAEMFTPDFAAITAVEALSACRSAGHTEANALRSCVEAATNPERLQRVR